ncbi:MAG: AbrB/MazE/SpoVT family DNA-binding domain-containing protein [Deltaproteobacteria bacterium]|nr:AbrB/MazE/SpoVT family DNA-binding domain-containing protein [Deltaproteobacteria bacterium]
MKIGERGQVTIPKILRERYGLFPNIEVEFMQEKDCLKIKKKSSRLTPARKMYGILNLHTKTDEYINEVRGE